MDAQGNPTFPWEVNWDQPGASPGGPPSRQVQPSLNPFAPGAGEGSFNEGETDPGPPPGVDPKKYREARAEEIAKNRQGLLQKAQHGRDFVKELDDYTDTIQQAPEWSFGPWAGSEKWQDYIDSPLAFAGFSAPERWARGAQVVNSKASAVTAALFRARYGGGPDESGSRGNRTEYQNIEKSIGTSGSFDKGTALQAAYGHGNEVAPAFNDALAAGQITRDFFSDLSPKRIQVGIKSGAIDPNKFNVLQPMTPQQAQALPRGTVFRTQDGRIMTR